MTLARPKPSDWKRKLYTQCRDCKAAIVQRVGSVRMRRCADCAADMLYLERQQRHAWLVKQRTDAAGRLH